MTSKNKTQTDLYLLSCFPYRLSFHRICGPQLSLHGWLALARNNAGTSCSNFLIPCSCTVLSRAQVLMSSTAVPCPPLLPLRGSLLSLVPPHRIRSAQCLADSKFLTTVSSSHWAICRQVKWARALPHEPPPGQCHIVWRKTQPPQSPTGPGQFLITLGCLVRPIGS